MKRWGNPNEIAELIFFYAQISHYINGETIKIDGVDKYMKALGLIPTRLNSTRLPQKALLPINDIPLVIHTYKRAKLAKKLDDVFICCDDAKIKKVAEKYDAKVIITSRNHTNGTERINEAYFKLKKNYDFIVDIQGDEDL